MATVTLDDRDAAAIEAAAFEAHAMLIGILALAGQLESTDESASIVRLASLTTQRVMVAHNRIDELNVRGDAEAEVAHG